MPNHNKPTTGFHTNPERINTKGAPKKPWTWSGLLKEMMDQSEEDGEPVKVKVARALKLKAYEGDVTAIKEIGNRVEGMPVQQVKQDGDLNLNIKWQDGNNNPVQPDASPEGDTPEQE